MSSGKSKFHLQQIESLILNILNNTLKYEIYNDELKHVSFTYVVLSKDHIHLKVFVDCFDRKTINKKIKLLNNAKGVFRTAIAKKTKLYRAPNIIFLSDVTIDKNLQIEEILNKLNNI